MSNPTISENLGLYLAQHHKRLRAIRRELRRLERRSWWLRIKARFKGGKNVLR
jgi:hypothetical protein